MSKENHSSEGLLRKFLRTGSLLGIPLGAWYATGSTIERYGMSTNALLSVDFLTLFVFAAVVGFILAGAWQVLLEIIFRVYDYKSPWQGGPVTPFSVIVVEGGVRYGVPLGFFIPVATIFGDHGMSWDLVLWLSFFFSLGFYLVGFFLIGCVLGLFMFKIAKLARPPSQG